MIDQISLIKGAVSSILLAIGENTDRDGLLKTPERVAKAWLEMTEGYKQNPAEILKARFEATYDEMVVVKDIEFYSTCEHHLLPFIGKAHVAYIPNDKVVGLSKLARLVDCFAKRLQIQEQMTSQIADAIMYNLAPKGCGVVIEAKHLCMVCRGVKKQNSTMKTQCLKGIFKEDQACREEFLMSIG